MGALLYDIPGEFRIGATADAVSNDDRTLQRCVVISTIGLEILCLAVRWTDVVELA